jgi:tight adherence protein C
MDQQLLLIFCIAGTVAAAAYALSRLLIGETDEKLRQRLSGRGDAETSRGGSPLAGETVVPILQRIGQAAASPFMPKSRETISGLRKSLGYAGIYSPIAIKLVTGAKAIALCVGLIVGYGLGLAIDNMMLGVPVGALLAYLMPRLWLRLKINENQRKLTIGLPDALDLMVVCVEAGLGLDQAMRKVAEEMKKAYRVIAEEFGLCNLQLQMGRARNEVLHDLGARTGVDDLKALAAILIQADKFGSSVAQALRVQSDSMRTRRRQLAEEKAAKTAVKLIFPLVLFIFPAIFVVLVGPAAITMINELFPSMNGTK